MLLDLRPAAPQAGRETPGRGNPARTGSSEVSEPREDVQQIAGSLHTGYANKVRGSAVESR